jgi:uncharacterized protein YneF (UPF0154 family)
VSLRSSLWRYLGLLVVAALAVGVFAGPASAKKLNAKQRAAVRAQLKKQIKKNPKLINKKSFVKRAALVNFKLPVTIRLRGSDANSNPNRATVDLGASLGQREVNLGGKLAAEITFRDSYDGGALGNVDLDILPSSTKSLTSTSIPLLWNTQVSTGRYDANALGLPAAASGCGNFTGSAAVPFGAGLGPGPAPVGGIPQPGGLPGYPYFDPAVSTTAPGGFLPVKPGIDSIDQVVPGAVPGNNNIVGNNPAPFPSAASAPGSFSQPPSTQDTVLRTNALNLNIANPGTPVDQSTNANGVAGSQNIVIGKSGGQANLFGNIPGKSYGIDVTVSLATRINSILRVVDQDSFGSPLLTGDRYPAGIFNCRQIWTGGIQNYIPDVRLTGNLKIAPGITNDGHLRIAKAKISSQAGFPTRFAVAACLAPYAGVAAEQNSSDSVDSAIPPATTPPGGVVPDSQLPANTALARSAPAAACNDQPTELVRDSGMTRNSVNVLNNASTANGFTVQNSGSAVTVAADLNVNNVDVDVLIGDV